MEVVMSFWMVFPLGALISAAPQDKVNEYYTRLLLGHRFPTRQALESVHPKPAGPLMVMAGSSKSPPTLRKRAILALRYFPGLKVRRFLRHLMNGKKTFPPFSRAALRAYVRAFPASAVSLLKRTLGDRRLQFRLTAAYELGRIGGKKMKAILKKRLDKEKSPIMRRHLRRLIKGQ